MNFESRKRPRHLFIPDTQVKPGVNTDHLEACGNYIVDKKPDTVIHIGDHWDMPSLSQYEKKGSKYFHDKSYQADVEAGKEGMERLLRPLWDYNDRMKKNSKKQYWPRMVFCWGNHENRQTRAVHDDPVLDGVMSPKDFEIEKFGWEEYPFLQIVKVDGIIYVHYVCNPNSLKLNPLGGTIENKLKAVGNSFSMGHQQIRQYGTIYNALGQELHGLVCGAFYSHDEEYPGPQGNKQWRGIIMKNEVHKGEYDPCFVSLNYLLREWL